MVRAPGASTYLADRDDHSVLDVDVAAGDVAGVGLHGHHIGVADDQVGAPRQPGHRLRRSEGRRAAEPGHPEGAERRAALHQRAAGDACRTQVDHGAQLSHPRLLLGNCGTILELCDRLSTGGDNLDSRRMSAQG